MEDGEEVRKYSSGEGGQFRIPIRREFGTIKDFTGPGGTELFICIYVGGGAARPGDDPTR